MWVSPICAQMSPALSQPPSPFPSPVNQPDGVMERKLWEGLLTMRLALASWAPPKPNLISCYVGLYQRSEMLHVPQVISSRLQLVKPHLPMTGYPRRQGHRAGTMLLGRLSAELYTRVSKTTRQKKIYANSLPRSWALSWSARTPLF